MNISGAGRQRKWVEVGRAKANLAKVAGVAGVRMARVVTAAAVRVPRACRGGCRAGVLGLALLWLAAGQAAAQGEYRCFGETAPAAKPAGSATVSLAYRGIKQDFTKWRDGHVPVTIDHRGAPAAYAKADFEALLRSVFEELEGVADLTFEYRAIPAASDGELTDTELDAMFDDFQGILFQWSDRRDFAGRAITALFQPGLGAIQRKERQDRELAELGYVSLWRSRLQISSHHFANYIEYLSPATRRYLIVHELLHGLGLGHSDNPLSIMYGGPYRSDRAGLHTDDIAGLQALYGLPDEYAPLAVDLGPAPVGVGLDMSNSGFLFGTWLEFESGSDANIPLSRANNLQGLFHWMAVGDLSRPQLQLDICVTGSAAGELGSAEVYQTSPSGEVFRYLADNAEYPREHPYECPDENLLQFELSHPDYYAAQSGSWKFSVGANGGLLADVMVNIDTAVQPYLHATSHGTLDVTRRGDGVFDLASHLGDGGKSDEPGFHHGWHVPGYVSRAGSFLTSPLDSDFSPQVEFSEPGVYEVFAESSDARRYSNEGSGFSALARAYLAVPRESGLPSLFGDDGNDTFLHVPAVDVSGSTLATALNLAGVDVSGGHVELLLKRTRHAAEQYKLVDAFDAAAPAKATASVAANGQLVLADVVEDGGMRRSMTLSLITGSKPLRLAVGSPMMPATPSSAEPTASPGLPSEASTPRGKVAEVVRLTPPARWPLGEAVPVAYVHDYELGSYSEAEIREQFFLPALRIIEGVAGVTFRVVDHDLEDGPFAGILISLRSSADHRRDWEVIERTGKERFGELLGHVKARTWGMRDPQLGVAEIRAALVRLHGDRCIRYSGPGQCDSYAEVIHDRNQWMQIFVKPLIAALDIEHPGSGGGFSYYLPNARQIEALQALYGSPVAPVRPADVFDPVENLAPLTEDLGLSVEETELRFDGKDVGKNEEGEIEIDAWRGRIGELTLRVRMPVAPSSAAPETFADVKDFYDFHILLADPAGDIREAVRQCNISSNGKLPLIKMTLICNITAGDMLASSPGTWKAVVMVRGMMLHVANFEVNLPERDRPAIRFNRPPKVELSVAALGGGRFRLGMDAEDAEGDPFLLAWAGPGHEPVIPLDVNRTWRENLPEPVLLDYANLQPGIYQVFAKAAVELRAVWNPSWHSTYIAVPRRPGVASYFPMEKILHIPAIQTGNGVREWNLGRVGEPGEMGIRFRLLDSKRVEGSAAAVMPDPQTGSFRLDTLLGFGRDCGKARVEEVEDTDPPMLRVFCESVSNQAPAVANPLADQRARPGVSFMFTLPDDVFSDADGDALTYRHSVSPAADWLSFDAETVAFSGTPPEDAPGTDYSVTVTADDGYDDGAETTFTLALKPNVAPTRVSYPPTQRARAGLPFVFTLPDDTFADADGDALTFSHSVSPAADWLSFDAETGLFSGAPPDDIPNTVFSVEVTVDDGYGGIARTTFIIVHRRNSAPYGANLTVQYARVGVPFVFTLPDDTFVDIDGDALTLSHSVNPVADWLSFDAGTGIFSGVPPDEVIGTDFETPFSVTVTADDGYGGSAEMTFTLAVRPNTAPAHANYLSDQHTRAGLFFVFTTPDDTFLDIDGDALTFSHSVSPAADWLSFDAETATFSGTPTDDASGAVFGVTVTAYDGYGGSADMIFSIVVANPDVTGGDANAAPTVNFPALPDATAYVGLPFSYWVGGNVFRDGDLDALSFSVAMADGGEWPAWLSFDEGGGEFRGTPKAGDASDVALAIHVTANDGVDTSAPARFNLRVAQPPAMATGTFDTDSAAAEVMLPNVSVQLGRDSLQYSCVSMVLTRRQPGSWTAGYGISATGCGVPASGHEAPLLDDYGGSLALRVPLAELASEGGRVVCMALEFAQDGADFRTFRLVAAAAAECPSQAP